MQNLICLSNIKTNARTVFTFTQGSDTVRQSSSTGWMVDISKEEAMARINAIRVQAGWTHTNKDLKA